MNIFLVPKIGTEYRNTFCTDEKRETLNNHRIKGSSAPLSPPVFIDCKKTGLSHLLVATTAQNPICKQ